jgi:hypothetical protein
MSVAVQVPQFNPNLNIGDCYVLSPSGNRWQMLKPHLIDAVHDGMSANASTPWRDGDGGDGSDAPTKKTRIFHCGQTPTGDGRYHVRFHRDDDWRIEILGVGGWHRVMVIQPN